MRSNSVSKAARANPGALTLLGALIIACASGPASGEAGPSGDILILSAVRSAPFPEARLKITSPEEGETVTDGKVAVSFDLQGFETGVQTPGAEEKGLANSAKGQHVHVIVDNGPYMAVYDVTKPFPVGELAPGTHVLRAFPSRSYHESVKTDGAFAMVTFHVEKESGAPVGADDPILTYSRPKGEYTGKGAKRIMVDFYVTNTEVSPDGHRVRLTVDGSTQKIIDAWIPHLVAGLEDGEHTFRLELLDKDGKPVPGAFNNTERTIQVKSAP